MYNKMKMIKVLIEQLGIKLLVNDLLPYNTDRLKVSP